MNQSERLAHEKEDESLRKLDELERLALEDLEDF